MADGISISLPYVTAMVSAAGFLGGMFTLLFKSGRYSKTIEDGISETAKELKETKNTMEKIEQVIWDEEKKRIRFISVDDCSMRQNICSSEVGVMIMSNKKELEQKIDNVERSLQQDIKHIKSTLDEIKKTNHAQSEQFNNYVKETSTILGGLKEAVGIIKDWKNNGGSHTKV